MIFRRHTVRARINESLDQVEHTIPQVDAPMPAVPTGYILTTFAGDTPIRLPFDQHHEALAYICRTGIQRPYFLDATYDVAQVLPAGRPMPGFPATASPPSLPRPAGTFAKYSTRPKGNQ